MLGNLRCYENMSLLHILEVAEIHALNLHPGKINKQNAGIHTCGVIYGE